MFVFLVIFFACSKPAVENTVVESVIEESDVEENIIDIEEPKSDLPVDKITLPAGFKIDVFADNLENARSMTMGDQGTLFVSTRKEGAVYAVFDKDKDYRADKTQIIASGLNMPNGVAFKDGDLYVAEVNKIWKYPGIEPSLLNDSGTVPEPILISDAFPSDDSHGWKYIAFGPDGKLYIPVGAPCNICLKSNEIYASICRMNPDGSDLEVYAHGIRNTVGFAWHPVTQELWFTENGRDWMGDDIPPCELNRAPEKGMHFGYPFCHGGTIPDTEFGDDRECNEFTPPVQNLGPHVAPLGMLFYTGDMFPTDYKNQVLLAEHGSWNRDKKIGYRVMQVNLNEDQESTSYQTFAEGWLESDENVWGRPVDLLQLQDGSILVSDDRAGAIYRITYQN